MLRRRPSSLVAGAAREEELQWVALHPHGCSVSIRSHHPILWIQGSRTSYLSGFLTLERGVGGEPSLLLERRTFAVVGAGKNHRPVQPADHLHLQRRLLIEVSRR